MQTRPSVIPIASKPRAARECGGCTKCCDGWLTGTIRGHSMEPGKPCHFRGEHGCTIYEERPQDPCRGFVCGWLREHSPFPEFFRPDRLGIIMLPLRWRDRIAYVLTPAGRTPATPLLDWMRDLSTATGTPFLFRVDGRLRGYGPPEFQRDIFERVQRGEPPLDGMRAGPGGACKLVPLDP